MTGLRHHISSSSVLVGRTGGHEWRYWLLCCCGDGGGALLLQDPQQQQGPPCGGGGGGSRKGGLIRDINRHAAVVMEGMPASLPADASDAAALLAAEQAVGE